MFNSVKSHTRGRDTSDTTIIFGGILSKGVVRWNVRTIWKEESLPTVRCGACLIFYKNYSLKVAVIIDDPVGNNPVMLRWEL